MLVAIGVIIGDRIVIDQGAPARSGRRTSSTSNTRMVVVGFIVAHLVSVFFYYPERIRENWTVIFNPFARAVVVRRLPGRAARVPLVHTNAPRSAPAATPIRSALGLSIGWIFGRTGCFTAHDHPGRHSTFFLAVQYPNGGPRHDLGLYELLFTIVLAAFLFLYNRKPRPPGPLDRHRGAGVRAGALPGSISCARPTCHARTNVTSG